MVGLVLYSIVDSNEIITFQYKTISSFKDVTSTLILAIVTVDLFILFFGFLYFLYCFQAFFFGDKLFQGFIQKNKFVNRHKKVDTIVGYKEFNAQTMSVKEILIHLVCIPSAYFAVGFLQVLPVNELVYISTIHFLESNIFSKMSKENFIIDRDV